jgi:hypothetical protein
MKTSIHVAPERVVEAQEVLREMIRTNKKIGNMPKPFHTLLVVIEDNIGGFFFVPVPEDLKSKVKERVVVVPDFDYRDQKNEQAKKSVSAKAA